jgi:hypothetical protein
MINLTFLGLAEKVLEEQKRPLSPSEIWKVAVKQGYDSMLQAKQGKTPAATLYSAIFTDARQNPETIFIKLGDRPARYYLKKLASKQPQSLRKQHQLMRPYLRSISIRRAIFTRFWPDLLTRSLAHTQRRSDSRLLIRKSLANGYTPT